MLGRGFFDSSVVGLAEDVLSNLGRAGFLEDTLGCTNALLLDELVRVAGVSFLEEILGLDIAELFAFLSVTAEAEGRDRRGPPFWETDGALVEIFLLSLPLVFLDSVDLDDLAGDGTGAGATGREVSRFGKNNSSSTSISPSPSSQINEEEAERCTGVLSTRVWFTATEVAASFSAAIRAFSSSSSR